MFRDEYKEFQFMVNELMKLRSHNVKGKADVEYFLFSEALLTCTALERFLRMIPDLKATKDDMLSVLLNRAFVKKSSKILNLPDAQKKTVLVNRLRNGLLHGNFEQLATMHGLPDKDSYFKKGQFQKDTDEVFSVLKFLVDNINAVTGKPNVQTP